MIKGGLVTTKRKTKKKSKRAKPLPNTLKIAEGMIREIKANKKIWSATRKFIDSLSKTRIRQRILLSPNQYSTLLDCYEQWVLTPKEN